MESDNLLADDVHRGPVLFEVVITIVHVAQSGGVVEERIHPDIDHVARVKVHRHSPLEAGTGDTEVLKARLDEVVDHLVDTGGGLQESAGLQKVLHGLGIFGKAEEIGLLLSVMDGTSAVRAAAVYQLALSPEALTGRAVFALISAFINIPVVVHFAEDTLDGGDVVIVGRADETVVRDIHELPEVQDTAGAFDDLIHKGLGRDASFLRFFLDLLAMFIRAGKEHNIIAPQALIAGDGVSGDGAVGVADVKLIRGIIDRRGDEEGFFRHLYFLLSGEDTGVIENTFLTQDPAIGKRTVLLTVLPQHPDGALLQAIQSRDREDGRCP